MKPRPEHLDLLEIHQFDGIQCIQCNITAASQFYDHKKKKHLKNCAQKFRFLFMKGSSK